MSTFLQHVQEFYREMGYSGAVPTSVSGQSSQKRNAVDWISKAEYEINSKWFDWDYLWDEWSRAMVVGTANYAAPADLGTYDKESFTLDKTSDSNTDLDYIPYKEWRSHYRNGANSNGAPFAFTILPDKTITLEPTPDIVQILTADYWKEPTKLSADADTSPIPTQFDRIILLRAKFFHYSYFDDGKIPPAVMGEYADILSKLEASQLPDREDRMSESVPMDILVL